MLSTAEADFLDRLAEFERFVGRHEDVGRGMPPPIAPPSGDGDNDGMDGRIPALERSMVDVRERLVRIETRLEQVATKGDLIDVYKAINTQTWKLIGTVAALVAAVIAIVRHFPPTT